MGSVIGIFMCLSNLYISLKIGWSLGVAITACIISFSIGKLLSHPLSILENNAMQSTASSAGYSTGGIVASAISAYLIINGYHISWVTLLFWIFLTSALGVFMAIPMKRQMINIEKLPFPSGIAAAEVLRSLYADNLQSIKRARCLFTALFAGSFISWMREGMAFIIKKWHWPSWLVIPDTFPIPWLSFSGRAAADYTLYISSSLILVAAGAIIGIRVGTSLLIGALVNYALLAPWLYKHNMIDPALGLHHITPWSIWIGVAIMGSASLLQFILQWRSVIYAFSSFKSFFNKSPSAEVDPLAHIEVPASWFFSGILLISTGCILTAWIAFGIQPWLSALAVLMSFFFCIIAARATGETDITPQGTLGKVSQLFYNLISSGNITSNLMTASITSGAASTTGDLLTDLKSGYLLGANPRQQFLAQLAGVFVGAPVIVIAYRLLIHSPADLGTEQWPAPAAQVWVAIAHLINEGIQAIPSSARWAAFIGILIGVTITLLEKYFPNKKSYIPSAIGLGLAFVISGANSISMFIGSLSAWFLTRKNPANHDNWIIPIAAGLIAGESLMGIAIAIIQSLING